MYQITTLSETSKDINVTVCTHLWFSDRYLTQTHTHISAQVHLYITCLPCVMLHSSNVEHLMHAQKFREIHLRLIFCDFSIQYSLQYSLYLSLTLNGHDLISHLTIWNYVIQVLLCHWWAQVHSITKPKLILKHYIAYHLKAYNL